MHAKPAERHLAQCTAEPSRHCVGLVLNAKYVSLRPHHMLWLVPSMTMAFCQPATSPALSFLPSFPSHPTSAKSARRAASPSPGQVPHLWCARGGGRATPRTKLAALRSGVPTLSVLRDLGHQVAGPGMPGRRRRRGAAGSSAQRRCPVKYKPPHPTRWASVDAGPRGAQNLLCALTWLVCTSEAERVSGQKHFLGGALFITPLTQKHPKTRLKKNEAKTTSASGPENLF
jgi:hypothetical protein